jgi:hypothetical protein
MTSRRCANGLRAARPQYAGFDERAVRPTIAALAGAADIEVSEASGDYALFGEVDFTHPIFAPFADPRFSDFSRIHFWKHRRWTIGAEPSGSCAGEIR